MTSQPPDNGSTRTRVGGRYELSGLLGRGGMAEVRRGEDLRLGRTVAVKRLRTDLASDSTFQARFHREAQSAASLNHPAIVAVYDTGEETATDGSELSIPYIVMEYVEGKTLRDIVREGRKILPERALEITADVLAALDYSHRAGIIHRDIKPANVMLTPSGDVKVMDFGIARALADSSATMTQTAAVVGTAQYLSPEQARGEQVDARSDIYSTGVLLFELLAGRPPFVGDSPVAVAYQHVREEPPTPSTFDPDISPELDAITLKALTKSTADRYQSAAEMRADIERALAGQEVSAPAAVAGAGAGAASPFLPDTDDDETTVGAPLVDDEQRRRRRRWLWALLAAVAVLLLILGAVFLPGLLQDEQAPRTRVPTVVGMTLAEAEDAIERAGLRVDDDVERRSDDTVPRNEVLEQSPEPGGTPERGTVVELVVSSGKPVVSLPNLIGSRLSEARVELDARNLRIRVQRAEADVSRNEVLSTDPEAGTDVRQGSRVTVVVSRGLTVVPDVVGLSQDAAIDELDDRGIGYQVVEDPAAEVAAGIVSRQSPPAGSRIESDDAVVVFVSTQVAEPTPEDTPTPTETTTPEDTPTPTPTETTTPEDTPTPTPTETTTPEETTEPPTEIPTPEETPTSIPTSPETPPGRDDDDGDEGDGEVDLPEVPDDPTAQP